MLTGPIPSDKRVSDEEWCEPVFSPGRHSVHSRWGRPSGRAGRLAHVRVSRNFRTITFVTITFVQRQVSP